MLSLCMVSLTESYSGTATDTSKAPDGTARIILYPKDSGEDTVCTNGGNIASAINDGFSQLTESNDLEKYKIMKYNTSNYPGSDVYSDGDSTPTVTDKFTTWLKDNSPYYPESATDGKVGCHMLILSELADAGGTGTYQQSDVAFQNAVPMVCGRNHNELPSGEIYNYAIQEPLHSFVAEDWLHNNTSLLDPNDPDEHQLGMVFGDGSVTPFLTGHCGPNDTQSDDDTGEGECSTGYSFSGTYTKTLTSCTKDAMRKTAKNT